MFLYVHMNMHRSECWFSKVLVHAIKFTDFVKT